MDDMVNPHSPDELGRDPFMRSIGRPSFFKRTIVAGFRQVIQLSLALQGRKYQYVFVLAHMRSGSTLLSHILANHPKFAGAAETHILYRTTADLPNLTIVTCRRLRKLWLSAQYVVDQINHNEYLEGEIFSTPLVHKCVILIRPPKATLQSMISYFGCEEEIALEYYVNRLEALVQYGTMLRERAMLVVYDDLVDRTEETLAALTNFFDVSQTFEPYYATHKATFGDPSGNIFSGRVIRTKSHEIGIGTDTLTMASMAFEECRERLLHAGVRRSMKDRPPPLSN